MLGDFDAFYRLYDQSQAQREADRLTEMWKVQRWIELRSRELQDLERMWSRS